MNREQIFSDVQDIFRDVFDANELDIRDETNVEDIEDWDSFVQVRLVIAIEKHFGIKFAFGELQNASNVGDMIKMIEEKKK